VIGCESGKKQVSFA